MAANASGITQETKVGKEMILIVIKAWERCILGWEYKTSKMYFWNTIMLCSVGVSWFVTHTPRMWWFRGFYHIDNCCSDHMHMFYRSHVNIVVNLLWCSIIREILQLIGDYIYSSWPVFSVSFLPSMSFFPQAKNFEINNSIFNNVSGSVQSGKKDLRDYSYYQTTC